MGGSTDARDPDRGSALSLAFDAAFGNDIAQVRAKAALVELLGTEDRQVGAIHWRYQPMNVVRNAAALHQSLSAVAREGGLFEPLDALNARSALTAARAWEGIAGVGEHARRPVALITAAIDYELAGYQANASCLARRAQELSKGSRVEALASVVGSFLERRFVLLRELAEDATRPPEASETNITNLRDAAALALTARGLERVSAYFLRGDVTGCEDGANLLDLALHGFLEAGAAAEASMVGGVRSLLPVMTARSTWRHLASVAPQNPVWQRYVKALARGIGPSFRTARSVSELWPSQLRALDEGLLEEGRSKVIRMPTSAGKTRVAEIAMVHELLTRPGGRCLYIAPYRALASEVERALDELLGEVGLTVSAIFGGLEEIGVEDLVVADDHVLVCTPEKADALLRVHAALLAPVHMVILDEGQVVADATRGVAYDLLVTRLRRRLPDARFLFLSAVVPDETLHDFAQWLGAETRDIITSQWRPAVQRLARFEWHGTRGTLRFVGGEREADLAQFLPGLVTERTFEYVNEATGRINHARFPDAGNKGQIAAALACEFVRTGPVLIFSSQTNWAESAAKALLWRLELAQLAGEPGFDLIHPRATAAEVAAEWLGDDHIATRLLRAGIGIHHGRLPEAVREAVEDDVRGGRIRILAATTTLAQGVNLPVRTVIIHSVWRSDSDGNRERIPARDYWNIAGRAGRAVHETDGLVVHITTSDQDERDFEFFADARENVELVVGATSRLLRDLMHERISSEDAAHQLDAELLALLVEEATDDAGELERRVTATINESFGAAQAERRGVSVEPLSRLAVATANEIRSATPSWERLGVFARTGLSSRSCRLLGTAIARAPSIGRVLVDAESATEVISVVLEPLLGIEEMQPQASYGGSYLQLLLLWTSGLRIPQIVLQSGDEAGTPEEAARFIEDLAGFRLPWGISAFNQIAASSLELEQLSPFASALPGMVKYGVPTPSSAWLMGLGIRSRQGAIALAARAAPDIAVPSPVALRSWLALQQPEELGIELGIVGQSLVNLSDTARRARRGHLALQLREGMFPLRTTVIVPPRGPAAEAFASIGAATEVQLARDYGSVLDRSAVNVVAAGLLLGALPSDAAELLALELDTGAPVRATVTAADVVDGHRRLHLQVDMAP